MSAKSTPEARAAKLAAAHDTLTAAVESLATSEGWRAYAAALAKFHRYSLNNTLLILCQAPEASHVAGFRRWLELGRCVRKGERGIAIFAPCPFRRTVAAEDGGEEEESRVTFRLAYVFDIAQTDPIPGHPNPFAPRRVRHGIAGDDEEARRLFAALSAHLIGSGIVARIDVGPEAVPHDTARGCWEPATRRLSIRPGEPAAQLSTLLHEAAHAAITARRLEIPRPAEEVIAQSVSYAVGAALGIDNEADSAEYVLHWAKDPAIVRAAAGACQAIAAELLAALDGPADRALPEAA